MCDVHEALQNHSLGVRAACDPERLADFQLRLLLNSDIMMASSTHHDIIQQEAIARAKAAFHKLPHNDELLQQCIANEVSLETVVKRLRDQSVAHERKRSTKLLERFHHYTSWMMNMSRSIDVAVNASAGIACPVWAPIKFVLMVCNRPPISTTSSFSLDFA